MLASKYNCKDFTKDKHCSNCGQCCMPILPITFEEYKIIKEYIQTHHIEKQSPIDLEHQNIYMDCPFHDRTNKKCTIYPVRPEVCKNFLCNHSMKRVNKDRKYYDERADINGKHLDRFVPFDLLFYDDPTLALFYAQDIMNDTQLIKNEKVFIDILCRLGAGFSNDEIPNTREIAEAILRKDIRLEWSKDD